MVVLNSKYCSYCRKVTKGYTACKDCFFVKGIVRKYCVKCGGKLDRTGWICKNCWLKQYSTASRTKGIQNLINQQKINQDCVFRQGVSCTNKNMSFQGVHFKCDFKPRTDCIYFKAKYPEILEFIKKIKKIKNERINKKNSNL